MTEPTCHYCGASGMTKDAPTPDVAFLPIECPQCGRKANSARVEMDPPEAVKARILCPDCVGGDFGETTYFDSDGNEILFGPDGHAKEPSDG